MPSGIIETLWLVGQDANGIIRYAPTGDWTEAAFARDVLGNVYARVERVAGYGVGLRSPADIGGVSWIVFPTLNAARRYREAAVESVVERTRASDR